MEFSLVSYDISDDEDEINDEKEEMTVKKNFNTQYSEDSVKHNYDKSTKQHYSEWCKNLEPPIGNPSPSLQSRIEELHKSRAAGNSFNRSLRKNESFNRPDKLDLMIKKFQIDQYGTYFKKDIYDPYKFESSDKYDALLKEQENYFRSLEEKQSQRTKINFTKPKY